MGLGPGPYPWVLLQSLSINVPATWSLCVLLLLQCPNFARYRQASGEASFCKNCVRLPIGASAPVTARAGHDALAGSSRSMATTAPSPSPSPVKRSATPVTGPAATATATDSLAANEPASTAPAAPAPVEASAAAGVVNPPSPQVPKSATPATAGSSSFGFGSSPAGTTPSPTVPTGAGTGLSIHTASEESTPATTPNPKTHAGCKWAFTVQHGFVGKRKLLKRSFDQLSMLEKLWHVWAVVFRTWRARAAGVLCVGVYLLFVLACIYTNFVDRIQVQFNMRGVSWTLIAGSATAVGVRAYLTFTVSCTT